MNTYDKKPVVPDEQHAARCACVYHPEDYHDDGTPKVRPGWIVACEWILMGVFAAAIIVLAVEGVRSWMG